MVAPTPGTTRDVVTARIAVDGFAVELADTAGLRADAGSLEGQGIELACAVAEANLTLWVVDAATQPVWPETQTWTLRIVVNKIDLPAAWDLNDAGDAPHVSAATGQGMTALADRLACWLVPEGAAGRGGRAVHARTMRRRRGDGAVARGGTNRGGAARGRGPRLAASVPRALGRALAERSRLNTVSPF